MTQQELQTQNYFSDVTLVCNENQFKAHRIIFLQGVNHKDLQNFKDQEKSLDIKNDVEKILEVEIVNSEDLKQIRN